MCVCGGGVEQPPITFGETEAEFHGPFIGEMMLYLCVSIVCVHVFWGGFTTEDKKDTHRGFFSVVRVAFHHRRRCFTSTSKEREKQARPSVIFPRLFFPLFCVLFSFVCLFAVLSFLPSCLFFCFPQHTDIHTHTRTHKSLTQASPAPKN